MLSKVLDVTTEFNANNGVKLDLSLWESATFCFITPTGTINITGTNDAGAVESVTDGNALTSTNYTAIQATNLASGTAVTSVSAAGNYKVTIGTKFIQFGGASAAAVKVLIFCNKPY